MNKYLGQFSHAVRNVVFPIKVYLVWHLIILIFQLFFETIIIEGFPKISLYEKLLFNWMYRWDGSHYLSISVNGYDFVNHQQAFFPLWPILVKFFSQFRVSIAESTYILSFFLSGGVFILFYLLTKKMIGADIGKRALICFAAFPSTMFLHSGYTESLYLFLTLFSFYAFEKKYYLLSALSAGFASATRIVGISLSALQLFSDVKFYRKIFYFLISLLGLIGYMTYLQITINDPLAFLKAHESWGRYPTILPSALFEYTFKLIEGKAFINLSSNFIDWITALITPIFLVAVYKKLGWNYFIYSVIVYCMALFSGAFYGMIRAVLVAFPIFMVFPLMVKNQLFFYLLCFLMFLLQLRFIVLFIHGIWVA